MPTRILVHDYVTVGGRNIVQVTRLSIVLAQRFFKELEDGEAQYIAPTGGGNGNGKKKNSNGNPVKRVR